MMTSLDKQLNFFITKVVTAVNNRNKLYAIAWKYISET